MKKRLSIILLLVAGLVINTLAQKKMTDVKTGYAPVNGIKMYYEIHGTGKMPLVLIHGGGSTIETSFGVLLPLLSNSTQIIAIELQAHGRTTDRDAPESFTQDADDVAALLQYLKIEKADILGFSNGGSTAMQMAIRHPQLVNKIISIAGATKRAGFISGFFESMPHATIDMMPQPLKDAYLKVTPNPKGLQTMFEKDRDRMATFQDWPDDQVKSIKAPTLLMVADKDVISVEHTAELSRLIPKATLIVLPGHHGGFIGEMGADPSNGVYPKVTAELIKHFLAS